MKTTAIREQIYEFIELYVDTPEPKKLCSSIEDLVDELAESKVKNLALSDVGKCEIIKEELWQEMNKAYKGYIDRKLDDTRIETYGKYVAFEKAIDLVDKQLK